MSIQQLNLVLSNKFEPNGFLQLAGQITGDRLGSFTAADIVLPAAITQAYHPEIVRGSSKGTDSIGIYSVKLQKSTLKNGFKIRRQLANAILNANDHNDALVAFHADGDKHWRLGFVRGYKYDALESLREFQAGEELAVRTARDQLTGLLSLPDSTEIGERSVALNEAFSVEAISDNFYEKFKKTHFDKIVESITNQGEDKEHAEDLAVLFTVRIMFLGFVQRKGWLADDQDFLKSILRTYQNSSTKAGFYDGWLKPLFFDALNGFGAHISSETLPEEIKKVFQMLPYLNGGLFHVHDVDKRNYHIEDEQIESFFNFLFSYNFTIEENTLQEQSLELNPELLGIIFERLVNKQNGAVYTPRTEVDFMCRISLVKWLQQNLTGDDKPDDRDLFELFFREKGGSKEFDDDQKSGSFSTNQKVVIISLLKGLAICDPAVGSGAFPVGMMQVLNEVLETLGEDKTEQARYERKKHIIGRNLYGVEVNEWAVWICQLRLWLSLFIDAPNDLRQSFEPILPSLDFKILQGDSLVQVVGNTLIPIEGHAAIDSSLKKKVSDLRNLKAKFYNNQLPSNITLKMIHNAEVALTKDMILEQRNAKLKDLQILRQKEIITQQSLLGIESDSVVQQALGDAEEREFMGEITKYDEMLSRLTSEPKTIWSISFAEVFADKGGFDIVIGNPPYVVVEDIEDPSGIYDSLSYKALLAEVMRADYYPRHDINKFKRISGFSGNSDLYVYFYMHTLKILNQSGVHTFICSSSWLDAGFASWMQSFLLKNVDIFGVYESSVKRSFSSADINTIISVMSAPRPKQLQSNSIKFINLKASFEESVITETLLSIDMAESLQKTQQYRVYPVERSKILDDSTLSGKFIGDKWGGKYLRSPDILVSLIEKGTWTLGDLLTKERYLNTGGADGFFLITEFEDDDDFYIINNRKCSDTGSTFTGRIEKKFFKPLVKDYLKTHKNMTIDGYDALCFVPSGEHELTPNAKNYIKWGEDNDYNKKSVTKLTNPWYKPTRQMLDGAVLVIPRSYGDVFISYSNPRKLLTLRYYRLHLNNAGITIDNLAAFMNSTLYWLYINALGNQSQGQGVLDVNMDDLVAKYRFPDIDLTKLNLSKEFSSRKINNIFTECGIDPEHPIEEQIPKPLPDRAELDKIIFDAMDLSENERQDVYRGVCRLSWNRLNKAKSV